MIAKNKKAFPNMKNKDLLSIEKFILECGKKMFHNNFQA